MKFPLLLITTFLITCAAFSQKTEGVSIGVEGGINQDLYPETSLYLNFDIPINKRMATARLGTNSRSYKTDYKRLTALDVNSIGFFFDLGGYLWEGLYAGMRIEFININWFTPHSINRLEEAHLTNPTYLYTGSCGFLQVGYRIPITQRIGIRLYGQGGLQQYKFEIDRSNNNSSSTSSHNTAVNHYKSEKERWIYNAHVALEIKIGH